MNKTQEQITNILERLSVVETKINEVVENHLPHLEEKLDRQQWFAITTLIGIIVILLFK